MLPIDKIGEKCPTCGSGKPHLHPGVQFGGEVQPCHDPWHRSTRLGVEAWRQLPATLKYVPPGPEREAMERPLREARGRQADAQRIAEMDAWIEQAEKELRCLCGHTAHWHGNGGAGCCEHDGECECSCFLAGTVIGAVETAILRAWEPVGGGLTPRLLKSLARAALAAVRGTGYASLNEGLPVNREQPQ